MIRRLKFPDPRLVLDVMPTDASILGFSNEWLQQAYVNSVVYILPAGQAIVELRQYIAERLKELSGHQVFPSGLEGALPSGAETPGRVEQVIRPRVDELISAGDS